MFYIGSPHFSALFNLTSFIFLLLAYKAIRSREVQLHIRWIASALSSSTLFLINYLIHHYNVGHVEFTKFGWIRTLYFTILISHIILSVVLLPMIFMTLKQAQGHHWLRHKKWAKPTFYIWVYVSITGLITYAMNFENL